MSDIFISYAAEDRERVKPLAAELNKEGWSVWWDRELKTGDLWHSVISKELTQARRVIVVWSESSVTKAFVLDEARDAQQRGILDPVLFDDVTIPLGFRGTQTTRMVGWSGDTRESSYQLLVSSLRARLDGENTPTAIQRAPSGKKRTPERRPGRTRLIALGLTLMVVLAGLLTWVYMPGISRPELVTIPGGTFMMGSAGSEEGRDRGEVARQQSVESFRLSPREVTVSEFREFVEAVDYITDAEHQGWCTSWTAAGFVKKHSVTWREPGFEQGDDHPVVCVSYNDATAFINWLSATSGQRFRLPTEVEWEYAARASNPAARHWGPQPDSACQYANVADLSFKARYPGASGGAPAGTGLYRPLQTHRCRDEHAHTAPVARYEANGFGAHDMMGNVLEWTADCAGSSSKCGRHGLRGGSWAGEVKYVRSANMYSFANSSRSTDVGFRLAGDL